MLTRRQFVRRYTDKAAKLSEPDKADFTFLWFFTGSVCVALNETKRRIKFLDDIAQDITDEEFKRLCDAYHN